jgi:hypothetical protein
MADGMIPPTNPVSDSHRALSNLGNALQIQVRPGLMALRMLADSENQTWTDGCAEGDELRIAVEWIADHLLEDVERIAEAADKASLAPAPSPWPVPACTVPGLCPCATPCSPMAGIAPAMGPKVPA